MEFNQHIETNGYEEEQPRRRFRSHRLRRGIYLLPSAFTVANMLCGYYAILAVLEGSLVDYDNAAKAIGIAYLFDSFDGRIARMMHTESAFGREFDSLADVISFGIAPAFLAYSWGVRAMAASNATQSLHLVKLGWLVGFIFLGCCAWRLARFNIQGMAPGGNRYFVGLPTPAAAGLVAAVVHYFGTPIEDVRLAFLWLGLLVILGVLMSSTVRYYSFKDIQWTKRQPSLAILLFFLILGAVVTESHPTLLILASTYVVHGPILQLVRYMRHRMATRPA